MLPVIAATTSIEASKAPFVSTVTESVNGPVLSDRDIVVQGRARDHQKDPLQRVNAKSFELTQSIDDAVTRPIAIAYKRKLPETVRDGLRNFLKNLSEPVVAVNFVLQHKIGKAGETVARFGLNSTVGAAGFFDIAKRKPFRLPRRPNGLAYTLGYYGVGAGPYLFLPLIGPTTARDMLGAIGDRMVLPFGVGFPFTEMSYSVPVGAVAAVDRRAEFDEDLENIRASGDPYVARREFYLRRRQREIDALRGTNEPLHPVAAQGQR